MFPLITFPYASRILNVENIGKINFSNSIMSYFVMIAGLGIANYAVREGSLYKNDKCLFNKFANEIFSINIISTLISYLLLICFVFLSNKLFDYKWLLAIQSLVLIFTTIGVDWINSIYEDYFYITFMTITFQIISLVLLFLFVHAEQDYYFYAFITVFANIGYNFFNFFHSKKYVHLRFAKIKSLKKHIKPIMIIFSTAIATTIYVNSGSTILGYISGDYYVGLYSVSVKIYSIFKQLLQGIVIVTLPRLSYLFANHLEKDYLVLLKKIFMLIIVIGFPTCTGLFVLSKDVINIISGENFLNAVTSLNILSIALVFSALATVATTSILLSQGKEKYIFKASLIGSIVNIILNFILIPLCDQAGAAISTLVAEIIIFVISMKYTDITYSNLFVKKDFVCSICEGICIFVSYKIISLFFSSSVVLIILTFILSIIEYIIILKVFDHSLLKEAINIVKSKFSFF